MTTAQEFGDRVAQARREKGVRERRDITQRAVAKAIGVSPTTISDCEAGKQIPGEAVIQRLAEHLGVTPAFLRYGITPLALGIQPDREKSVEETLTELRPPEKKANTVNGPRLGKRK